MDQLRGPVDWLTFDLYGAAGKVADCDLEDHNDNFVVGVFSAAAAAALIYIGSKGETEDKLSQVLRFDGLFEGRCTPEKIAIAFRQAVANLTKRPDTVWPIDEDVRNSGLKIYLANKAFFRHGTEVYDEFLSNAKMAFSHSADELADLEETDRNDVESIRKKINKWVCRQTDGRIVEMLEPMTFDKSVENLTNMWIANSCCMTGRWEYPFKKTFKSDFTLATGTKVIVDMMEITENFAYAEDDDLGVQYLEIPFAANEAALCLILPRIEKGGLFSLGHKKRQLSDVEKLLHYQSFMRVSRQKRFRTVDVQMPKFKIDNTFDLKELFEEVGLRSFFETKADLSRIAVDPDFHLSGAFHKVSIEFDEKGSLVGNDSDTKTQPNLALPKSFRNRSPSIPDIFQFHANRPFVFLVRHNMSGLIIFAGRVVEPNMTKSTSHLLSVSEKPRPQRAGSKPNGSPMLSRRDCSGSPKNSPNTQRKTDHTAVRIIDLPGIITPASKPEPDTKGKIQESFP